MSQRYFQGVESATIPASIEGGSNYSGVYTLDQLNRLNAVYPNHIGNSLRFRSSATAYLSRTPASASNQTTWTWSGWLKKGALTVFETVFTAGSSASNRFYLAFDASVGSGTPGDYLTCFTVIGGTLTNIFQTKAVFRDPSAWYQIGRAHV